jgi:hypothetical protein
MPVKLLLGRAMLLTRPSFTGSWLAMKTMGIVVVAALAAKGPRVHRGRATELNSRQFGVLCAEAALNAASTFHRSAVVDRVNIKSMSLHGLCRPMALTDASDTSALTVAIGAKRTGYPHCEPFRP